MSDEKYHFLHQLIQQDIESKRISSVVTRFSPEPNGYVHIGHAKSICLNFGLSQQFGGQCYLRFDDTNPAAEKQEYIDAILEDICWLGFEPDAVSYTSDYFDTLYQWAEYLIEQGNAYVCQLDSEQMRSSRGTLTKAGIDSPYRNRSMRESLQLFAQMRAGDMAEGAATLRAKIDMTHPQPLMRDPVLYRIKHQSHPRTKNAWCIYPSYDFAHGQSDAIEGITHSLCTLEFSDNRELYNWLLERLPVPHHPNQYEFARLELTHTLTSKRRLRELIDKKIVSGWDDPRMPTISGLRRAGYSSQSIRDFCTMVGVSRANSIIDRRQLEFCLRQDLDKHSLRAMCVLRPIELKLTNFHEIDASILLAAPNNPHEEQSGQRQLPFSDTLYIEQEDFRPEVNKKYKRLVMGGRVRLRYGYIIQATDYKEQDGRIVQVQAKIIPDTLGKNTEDGVKVRGVIHWVCAKDNTPCTLQLFNPLFMQEMVDSDNPEINPNSLEILQGYAERDAAKSKPLDRFQFERQGYFCRDSEESAVVFNRTISLRDGGSGFG